MNPRNSLHRTSIAVPQAMSIDMFHSADVRVTVFSNGDTQVAGNNARHAGGPQQFIADIFIDVLMDVA